MEQAINQRVLDILKSMPKTIDDDEHYLATYWASEDFTIKDPEFQRRQHNLLRYLAKHASAESLLRERRRVLEAHPTLKAAAKLSEEKKFYEPIKAPDPEIWSEGQKEEPKPLDDQVALNFAEARKALKHDK